MAEAPVISSASPPPAASVTVTNGFTWRAAIIGGLLVVFISIWSQ